jgi:hypothetical protein
VKLTFDGNRKRYASTAFSGTQDFPFGGMEISVPVGYDEYLTKCYGDWRTPPKIDERKSHAYDSSGHVWTVPCPNDDDRLL